MQLNENQTVNSLTLCINVYISLICMRKKVAWTNSFGRFHHRFRARALFRWNFAVFWGSNGFFLVRLPCAGGNKFANCNDLLIQKDNVHRLSRDKNICTVISDFAFSRHVIIYVDCNQYWCSNLDDNDTLSPFSLSFFKTQHFLSTLLFT